MNQADLTESKNSGWKEPNKRPEPMAVLRTAIAHH